MSVINTNVSALVAQSSLRSNSLKLSTAMERLSTGSKINSAKDDAAGQAISERMTSKIRGYAVAVRNANDGVSLAQTAEGDLNQIASNLQRIRELAVQSSNGANTQSDRDALNNESNSLVAEIDRIAQASSFNGSKLLDGNFVSKVFQVGAGNIAAQDQISVSIGSARTTSLGVTALASSTSAASGSALGATDLTINTIAIRAATAADDTVSTSGVVGASGIAKAAAINASTAATGVTATVGTTTLLGTAVTSTSGTVATGSISINGFATANFATTADGVANKALALTEINKLTSKTGVLATDLNPSGLGGITLTAADGRNIDVALTNFTSAGTGVGATAAYAATSSVNLTSANNIVIAGGAGIANAGVGAARTVLANSTGVSVATITLSTDVGARQAMDSVDAAITTINTSRASLGATQNRFLAAVNNLETASTNLSASRSRIMDTDYAAETTNLAKAQIISQAATAMLAQANQSQQSVLSLLK
jgi:flagellin